MATILTVHGTCNLHGVNFFEYTRLSLKKSQKEKTTLLMTCC